LLRRLRERASQFLKKITIFEKTRRKNKLFNLFRQQKEIDPGLYGSKVAGKH
jgi:hypothetical protein